MSYTTTFEMLRDAQSRGYAIVGFAAYNLETIKELVNTANRLRAPLIIQSTPRTIELFGIEYISSIVRTAANSVDTPVALHLDHGDSLNLVQNCLDYGYSSIMIDGSQLPYEENVQLVREVVSRAHGNGIPVEAELGRIGGVEDDLSVEEQDAGYTEPDAVVDFVVRTGVDSLAISIGTAHGMYRKMPQLNLKLLENIRKLVSIPLVLHGASGVPNQDIQQAISTGISKVNIATELKLAYSTALREFLTDNPAEIEPRKYLKPALQAYSEVVEHKLILAGAVNRFW